MNRVYEIAILLVETARVAARNALRGGARSAIAVAAIGFALLMVLLQLGFLNAVRITGTNLYNELDFDLMIVSPNYDELYSPGDFPRERLVRARSLPSVVAARPVFTSFGMWRCPPYPFDPAEYREKPLLKLLGLERPPQPLQRRELLVIGIDLDDNPFREPIRSRIEVEKSKLKLAGRVLLNERSNPEYGWPNRNRFHDWELNLTAVEVIGGFFMLRGFGSDGSLICGDRDFGEILGRDVDDRVNLGLVKVVPGTVQSTIKSLKKLLPNDVWILSREEMIRMESAYWVELTSTGTIFSIGVLVSLLVATIVIHQIVGADVRRRLAEYATLRACGHGATTNHAIVVFQSLIYGFAAFVPAVAGALGVYKLTEDATRIPMRLTTENLVIALATAITAGLVGSILALGKLRSADPADLM